jgi:hypothetical protein
MYVFFKEHLEPIDLICGILASLATVVGVGQYVYLHRRSKREDAIAEQAQAERAQLWELKGLDWAKKYYLADIQQAVKVANAFLNDETQKAALPTGPFYQQCVHQSGLIRCLERYLDDLVLYDPACASRELVLRELDKLVVPCAALNEEVPHLRRVVALVGKKTCADWLVRGD